MLARPAVFLQLLQAPFQDGLAHLERVHGGFTRHTSGGHCVPPSSRSAAVPDSALAPQPQLGQDRRGIAHPACRLLDRIASVALLPVLALISDDHVHAIILHQILDVLQRP